MAVGEGEAVIMDGNGIGEGVGAVAVTPGEILDQMNTVDALARQLDVDIAAAPVRAEFKAGWAGFLAEWRKFYEEHKGFTGRIWNSVYNDTLAYRRRFEDWSAAYAREAWQSRGAGPAGSAGPPAPGSARPPAARGGGDPDSGFPLSTVVWVAAGALLMGGLLIYGGEE
jgi:hypothetical protein